VGKELIGLGRAAVAAVHRGQSHTDPEVAERCRHLLPAVVDEANRRPLAEMHAPPREPPQKPTPKHEDRPPRVPEFAGDTPAARLLYLEVFTTHREFLDGLDPANPKAAGPAFGRYVDTVLMFPDGRSIVDLRSLPSPRSDVVLFWFLSAHPAVGRFRCDGSRRSDYPFFGPKYAKDHVTGEEGSPEVRRVFIGWLKGPRNYDDREVEGKCVLPGFRLAADAEIPELRPVALQTACDPKQCPAARAGALIALAKVGKSEDVQRLSGLVVDDTPLHGPKVLLGDIALATCERLAGWTPPDVERMDPRVELADYAFPDAARRAAARKKWAEFEADRNLSPGGKP